MGSASAPDSNKLAFSVVGTVNYMAPEVIRGLGYTASCDWWSLAIITYECLFGFTPFYDASRDNTRRKILNWHTYLGFPEDVILSNTAYDFLRGLICDSETRLGAQASSSEQSHIASSPGVKDMSALIKCHPWFEGWCLVAE